MGQENPRQICGCADWSTTPAFSPNKTVLRREKRDPDPGSETFRIQKKRGQAFHPRPFLRIFEWANDTHPQESSNQHYLVVEATARFLDLRNQETERKGRYSKHRNSFVHYLHLLERSSSGIS